MIENWLMSIVMSKLIYYWEYTYLSMTSPTLWAWIKGRSLLERTADSTWRARRDPRRKSSRDWNWINNRDWGNKSNHEIGNAKSETENQDFKRIAIWVGENASEFQIELIPQNP